MTHVNCPPKIPVRFSVRIQSVVGQKVQSRLTDYATHPPMTPAEVRDRPLVPRTNPRGQGSEDDPDECIEDLRYRDVMEFAVGHGHGDASRCCCRCLS